MKLIGYVRVSGLGQAADGFGLQVQTKTLKAWAKTHGHKLIAIESDEGVSGTTDAADRPGLSAALLAIREEAAEGIIAVRLDRYARALVTQEAILSLVWKAGGHVFTADNGEYLADDPDDPMRTLIRQILGAVAEMDRKLTVKRMKDGRAAKAASGRHSVGQYPYGTKGTGKGRDRDAGPDETEQATVARILALRSAGQSYRAIVDVLDAEGHKPRRAAAWNTMSVRNVVLRAGKQ